MRFAGFLAACCVPQDAFTFTLALELLTATALTHAITAIPMASRFMLLSRLLTLGVSLRLNGRHRNWKVAPSGVLSDVSDSTSISRP